MLLLKENQDQPGRLRFLLMLWFGLCIFAYSFLPPGAEAAAFASLASGASGANLAEENYLLIALLPVNEQVYAAKEESRAALAERARAREEAARKAAEAKARAEAEAAASRTEAEATEARGLAVPTSRQANSGFKSFMDYRVLQNRRSGQYILQQDAATDEQGFRVYDGCYMVALGTYYAKGVGERFRITLDSGVSFLAITGDIKSDAHTDPLHQHRGGNIVEFIVDTKKIPAKCKRMGDMSYAGLQGRIQSIEKI